MPDLQSKTSRNNFFSTSVSGECRYRLTARSHLMEHFSCAAKICRGEVAGAATALGNVRVQPNRSEVSLIRQLRGAGFFRRRHSNKFNSDLRLWNCASGAQGARSRMTRHRTWLGSAPPRPSMASAASVPKVCRRVITLPASVG